MRLGREWSMLLQRPATWEGIWGAFFDALSAGGPVLPWIWVLAAGAALVLGFGLCRAGVATAPHRAALFCAASSMAVILIFGAFLRVLSMDVRPWYLLGLLGIAALAIDALLTTTGDIAAQWGRVALAAFVALLTFPAAMKGVEVRQTNMDLVAAAVRERAAKGDLIVVTICHYGIGFQRYYGGPVPWMTLPPIEDLRIHRYDLLKEKMMAPDQQAVVRPVMEKVTEALKAGGRVWFVGGLPLAAAVEKPELLPPAPTGRSGWADPPYAEAWAAQVAYLVKAHAQRAEFVSVAAPLAVNLYEDVPLLVVEGWRSP
jgi:hypothetical protein